MSQIPELSDPAEGGSVDFNQLHHALLLIEVLSREEGIRTRMDLPGEPPKTAISCNITALDGPLAGTISDNVLVFPRVLVQQLKPKVGEWVLGRLGQGQADSGKTAPWKLEKATDADRALARQWFARPGAAPVNQTASASSYTPPPQAQRQQPQPVPQQQPAAWQQQGQLPTEEPPF